MSEPIFTDLTLILRSMGIDRNSPVPPYEFQLALRKLKRNLKDQHFKTPYEEEQGDDEFFVTQNAYMEMLFQSWEHLDKAQPEFFEKFKKNSLKNFPLLIADLNKELADPLSIHAHIKYEIAQWKKALDVIDNMSLSPLTDNTTKSGKAEKPFPEHLLLQTKQEQELLAEKLKTVFSTEYGKGIRLMIEALKNNDPPLITMRKGQGASVIRAIESYFNREIGRHQSIIGYDFKESKDKRDLDAIKNKLDFILKSIDNVK